MFGARIYCLWEIKDNSAEEKKTSQCEEKWMINTAGIISYGTHVRKDGQTHPLPSTNSHAQSRFDSSWVPWRISVIISLSLLHQTKGSFSLSGQMMKLPGKKRRTKWKANPGQQNAAGNMLESNLTLALH